MSRMGGMRRPCPHCKDQFGARALAYHIRACKENGQEQKQELVAVESMPIVQEKSTTTASTGISWPSTKEIKPTTTESPGIAWPSSMEKEKNKAEKPVSPGIQWPSQLTEPVREQYMKPAEENPGPLDHIKSRQNENYFKDDQQEQDDFDNKPIKPTVSILERARQSREGMNSKEKDQHTMGPSISQTRSGRRGKRASRKVDINIEFTDKADMMSVDHPKGSFQGSFNRSPIRRQEQQRMSMPVDVYSDEKANKIDKAIPELKEQKKVAEKPSVIVADAEAKVKSGVMPLLERLQDSEEKDDVTQKGAFQNKRLSHWMDDIPIRVAPLAEIAEIVPEIKQKPKPITEIPEHVDDIEMEKCPYCSRSFRTDVAKRHIPKCETTKARPKPPKTTVERGDKKLQNRLKATTSRPPLAKQKSVQLLDPADIAYGKALLPSPSGTPDATSSTNKYFSRPSIQLNKLRQAKDSVDQLVSSAMIAEIQKSRISPFRYESRGSFQSRGEGSQQSSPTRRESLKQEEAGKQLGSVTERNRVAYPRNITMAHQPEAPVESKQTFGEPKKSKPSLARKGIQVMACHKNTKSMIELKPHQDNFENLELKLQQSAKKDLKKQIDHSDVATRASMFSQIPCPACGRKFGAKAADAHIKYCTEKQRTQSYRIQTQTLSPTRAASRTKERREIVPTKPKVRNAQARVDTGLGQGRGETRQEQPKPIYDPPPKRLIKDLRPIQKQEESSFYVIPPVSGRPSIRMSRLLGSKAHQTSRSFIKPPSEVQHTTLEALRGSTYRNTIGVVQNHINQTTNRMQGKQFQSRIPSPAKSSSPVSRIKSQGFIKFCTNCGFRFEDAAHKFCGDCGTRRKNV